MTIMPDAQRNAQYDDPRRLLVATDTFTNTHTLEFYVSAMQLAWGLFNLGWWWMDPIAMAGMPLHSVLGRLMPQWLWGLIGIMLGGCHLLTPIAALRLRMLWLFGAFCLWSMITFMIFVELPYNTGVVAYGGLTVVVAICYLRLYLIHGELFHLTNFLAPVWRYLRRPQR